MYRNTNEGRTRQKPISIAHLRVEKKRKAKRENVSMKVKEI